MLIRKTLDVRTAGRGTVEITHSVQALIEQSSIDDGICNLFLKHTSASLILCENADPSVRRDVETFFANLVPDGNAQFTHTAEGPDDMSAHLRSILTQNSLSIPIANHRLDLGTWQGIYLWEHRTAPHHRQLTISFWC